MKILVCCNSDLLAFPTILRLKELGKLQGVCIPEKSEKFLMPTLKMMNLNVKLTCLTKNNWIDTIYNLIRNKQVDSVWVLTFPWIFPKFILDSLEYKFVNFHFGLLPKYKGNDPVFWQFKNKESHGGITVHYINEYIDEGPVILQEKTPIIPGETYGLHCQRIGLQNRTLIERVIDRQKEKRFSPIKLDTSSNIFSQKPHEKDLEIDWRNQTSEDIEYLVNASNPKYGGARTKIAGLEISILEVTPVSMKQNIIANPGQIIHADSIYGLIVYCVDNKCIRITIVNTREGFLSGVKLYNMGIKTGDTFESPVSLIEKCC